MTAPSLNSEKVISDTKRWLEKAVIGLNLCPFAAHPYRNGRVRFAASTATTAEELLADLETELHLLVEAEADECETTLLMHPGTLTDFLEYNDFLPACDALVEALDLEGVLQVASFDPYYQFADAACDGIENYTNRSPYPTLHLLRESSVTRAVESADTKEIYERNIRTLAALGLEGWLRLWRD